MKWKRLYAIACAGRNSSDRLVNLFNLIIEYGDTNDDNVDLLKRVEKLSYRFGCIRAHLSEWENKFDESIEDELVKLIVKIGNCASEFPAPSR